jgi:hypothetical protein
VAVESIRGVFWNLGGNERRELIARLASERKLNLIVLAEPSSSSEELLSQLNQHRRRRKFICPDSGTPRLQLFSRSNEFDLQEIHFDASRRLTIRRLSWNGQQHLFAAVHWISKRNWRDPNQYVEAQLLAGEIREREAEEGHRRTILVGDLNMNPFEPGVAAAACLHGMMSKAEIAAGSRVIQTREYPFFYNPMWGFFGDRTPGPPGTYYYHTSEHISFDWNMFDQILIRPDVLSSSREEVEIVRRIGDVDLLTTRGRPNQSIGSDHLPLFFSLNALASDKS